MPMAMVELDKVIDDYGPATEIYARNERYIPWAGRIEKCGVQNMITTFRAALIASGDLVLVDVDKDFMKKLTQAQSLRGGDVAAWSDDEIQVAIQLSTNEEARSIAEIEQRANIAKLIADKINSEDQ